jgi:ribosomal protein S6--L-glutamate ligase
MASDSTGLLELAKHVGGAPVIVKLLTSAEKTGVMICESMQSLEAALEAILGLGQDIIVQQYVKGARGRDLRALVVGGRVVAAVRRKPRVGRFSRTLARGAEFEPAELTPLQCRAAVEAARVVGLEVCGVDMLDVKGKPLVFEVNSSPGIKEAEQSCNVDVADAIVRRAEEIARERRGKPGRAPPRRAAASER